MGEARYSGDRASARGRGLRFGRSSPDAARGHVGQRLAVDRRVDRQGETTTRGRYPVSLADGPHDVSSAHGGHPVARMATRYVGTPYVWGGASPSGFDCSGFVKYVYATLGVVLPRTVRDQYAIGTTVSRDRLRAGDIVFFDRLRHNGVYLGDGRLIHASTMDGAVRMAKLNEGWFKERWVGARRLQPASGSTQAVGKRYGAGLIASRYPPTAPHLAAPSNVSDQ
jgi:cell wall-associated NlpC family hydrolase